MVAPAAASATNLGVAGLPPGRRSLRDGTRANVTTWNGLVGFPVGLKGVAGESWGTSDNEEPVRRIRRLREDMAPPPLECAACPTRTPRRCGPPRCRRQRYRLMRRVTLRSRVSCGHVLPSGGKGHHLRARRRVVCLGRVVRVVCRARACPSARWVLLRADVVVHELTSAGVAMARRETARGQNTWCEQSTSRLLTGPCADTRCDGPVSGTCRCARDVNVQALGTDDVMACAPTRRPSIARIAQLWRASEATAMSITPLSRDLGRTTRSPPHHFAIRRTKSAHMAYASRHSHEFRAIDSCGWIIATIPRSTAVAASPALSLTV